MWTIVLFALLQIQPENSAAVIIDSPRPATAVASAATAPERRPAETRFVETAEPVAGIDDELRWQPYVELVGGWTVLLDSDLTLRSGASTSRGEASFDPGFAAGGAFGVHLDETWSLEAEMLYRRNTIDRVKTDGGGPDIAEGGDFASLSVMVNVIHHFRSGKDWHPYVGLGVGWVEEIDIDLENGGTELGYDDSGFAYQGIVGVEWAGPAGLSFFGEARYFGASAFDLKSEDGTGDEVDADYGGLGLYFGVGTTF